MRLQVCILEELVPGRPSLLVADRRVLHGCHRDLHNRPHLNPYLPEKLPEKPSLVTIGCLLPLLVIQELENRRMEHEFTGCSSPRRRRPGLLPLHDSRTEALLLA